MHFKCGSVRNGAASCLSVGASWKLARWLVLLYCAALLRFDLV